jgi:NADH-quinone oxidoreductase subunit C
VEKGRVRLAYIVAAFGVPESVTEKTSQVSNVVVDALRAWSTNAIEEVIEFRGETTLVVARKVLRAIAARCREDNALQFDLLTDATCLDRFPMEPRFELNYHLVSIPKLVKVRLRVKLSGDDPVVDSLVPVWPGANWLEREIFDLFGIQFTGHPDLRRILLPDDWEGYPLRRDYPVEGFRDIPAIATRYTKGRP